MAGAPYKTGLSYFSHDTDLSDDPGIELLEAEHGLDGYAIYCKLLERIYRYDGYYLKADEKTLKLVAKKFNILPSELSVIIQTCIDEKLFSKEIFIKEKVLTSSGIQKRYLRSCDRRKRVELINVYLLLDNNSINDNINSDNVTIIKINAGKKAINVAESKVKEIESKEKIKESVTHPLQKFVAENLPNVSKLKIQLNENNCITLLEKFPKQVIKEVLEDMDNHKPLTKKYVDVYRTCNSWCKIRINRNGNQSNGKLQNSGEVDESLVTTL